MFAPAAKWRKQVAPASKLAPPVLHVAEPAVQPPPYRLPWALLLARTFVVDILLCPCGGQRKVLAFIPQPRVAQETLRLLGLPSSSPLLSPARWSSQDEFDLPPDHGGADPPFSSDFP